MLCRSCSVSSRERMRALRSRRVSFALASISSRSRSVRETGWEAAAPRLDVRRWVLRTTAVER